jgi:hypothetical protein
LQSLIERTWVTLEFGNHEYDPVQGYDQVVNIVTDVILGPNEPGYDHKKFIALMEQIKPYLRRYDKANVISKRADLTMNVGPAAKKPHVRVLASKRSAPSPCLPASAVVYLRSRSRTRPPWFSVKRG